MKRLSVILVCVAAMLTAASCSILGGAGANSVANASGRACGTAVQGLYSSYHTNGKLDLATGNNLSNALALATAYTQLQQNKDNADYRKSFTSGLIASSAGLITSANADSFIGSLLSASSLGGLTAEKVTQTASTVQTIVSLLQILKQ
ncbi:MAG: hypothetical protein IJ760_07020 [Bacteroidales bacterium]|nr:hypothetical protein [Bacteroidales bacterium]